MRSPRHVLMTSDTIGGAWTFTVDLCASLARYGVKITLATLGGLPDAAQVESITRCGNVELVPTECRTEWTPNCEKDLLRSGEDLIKLESTLAPDLVHLNGYRHAGLPFQAPVLVAAHSCLTSWWRACQKTSLPPEWENYEAGVSLAVRQADMLIAPTAAFLAEFQTLHGAAGAARIIPHGRFAALFKPRVKRRIVLAAGRLWDDAKNITILRKAANEVDVPIVVAGELVAPDGAVCEATGLAALGRLTPPEMARWMAEAAIFASPARYEPFGYAVLEAALSGCALILSDIPNLRELWDGVATFIEPDDVRGLRRAIRMLSETPQLAASDGQKARERALSYSAERMGDLYHRAYQDIMAASSIRTTGDVAA